MKAAILIIISLVGIFYNLKSSKKALLTIKEKNRNEPSKFKRAVNYPFSVLWHSYVFVFFIGLTVNNLIST